MFTLPKPVIACATAAAVVAGTLHPVLTSPAVVQAAAAAPFANPLPKVAGINDPSCQPSGAVKEPVVLLHGTSESSTAWEALIPNLQKHGMCVWAFDYGAEDTTLQNAIPSIKGIGDVFASGEEIATNIAYIRAVTGASKVNLVGHSQGGMQAKIYTEYLGHADSVARVVTVGANVHGTDMNGAAADLLKIIAAMPGMAQFLVSTAALQQILGSDTVKKLDTYPDTTTGIRYTSIYSPKDEVVTPNSSSFFKAVPGADSVNLNIFEVCGVAPKHVPLSNTPQSMAQILWGVERATGEKPDPKFCDIGAPATMGNPDLDGDGVNNADELAAGLDPRHADTDGNGVPDGEEDLDGDGIRNQDESQVPDGYIAAAYPDGLAKPEVTDRNGNGIEDIMEGEDVAFLPNLELTAVEGQPVTPVALVTPDRKVAVTATSLPPGLRIDANTATVQGTADPLVWGATEEEQVVQVPLSMPSPIVGKPALTATLSVTIQRDTDGDGISDLTDRDDDGDGYTDAKEKVDGTNPKDAASHFVDKDAPRLEHLDQVTVVSSEEMPAIRISSDDPSATYSIEGTLPAGIRFDGAAAIVGTPVVRDWAGAEEQRPFDITVVARDAAGNESRDAFAVVVQRDTDGDGTPDVTDLDDDGDGFSDKQEIAAGADPKNPNSIPAMDLTPATTAVPHPTEPTTPTSTSSAPSSSPSSPSSPSTSATAEPTVTTTSPSATATTSSITPAPSASPSVSPTSSVSPSPTVSTPVPAASSDGSSAGGIRKCAGIAAGVSAPLLLLAVPVVIAGRIGLPGVQPVQKMVVDALHTVDPRVADQVRRLNPAVAEGGAVALTAGVAAAVLAACTATPSSSAHAR